MFRTLLVHHWRIHLLYKTVIAQGCSREFTAVTTLCQTAANSAYVSSNEARNMTVVLFRLHFRLNLTIYSRASHRPRPTFVIP